MQYFASLQAQGMPSLPVQRITSANADIPTSSSGTQATCLPSRRLSPRARVQQCFGTNQFINGAADRLIGNFGNASLALWRNEAVKNVEEHVTNPQLTSYLPRSPSYEHDLSAMVHDYMENGSQGSDFHGSSDEESSALTDSKPFETLQAFISNKTVFEKDLLSVITTITLSLTDKDLPCFADASRNCRGGCIRRMLVKHLQLMKYNAAICSSKWPSVGKVPRGEYEYIDVIFGKGLGKSDRVIVDIDFQSQFKIARPTQSYLAALSCLPVLFIGSVEKLSQVLQVLAGAAKLSLKQNSMPLPPWRTLAYMKSKWMSRCERLNVKADENRSTYERGHEHTRPTGQCIQEWQYLKVSMSSGIFVPET